MAQERNESEPNLGQKQLLSVQQFTPLDFFANGRLPYRRMEDVCKITYDQLGLVRWTLMTLGDATDTHNQDLVVALPPLRGLRVYDLLHIVAPSKRYRYDLGDLLSDWPDLMDNPEQEQRRKRHETIPGWHIFAQDYDRVFGIIKASHLDNDMHLIVPVIHISRYMSDKPQWTYTGLPDSASRAIEKLYGGKPNKVLSPVSSLGPVALGIYAPEITSLWPEKDTYGHEAKSQSTQDQGSTQSYVQCIRYGGALLDSRFFYLLCALAEKNILIQTSPTSDGYGEPLDKLAANEPPKIGFEKFLSE